jgi:uncharacterized protein (TIGR03437 family)
MDPKRRRLLAKSAVLASVIPILLYAYEYGPDAGYSGVPGEKGTCTAVGCHVGTVNSGQGSISVAFPGGLSYAPGVKQHLVVTIADPSTSQRAWGFQLTARNASSSSTAAGVFASTNANTALMCAGNPLTDLGTQVPYSASNTQTCPAGKTLQYIEHSLAGYNATRGTGSGTFEFDWTPPSSNVGDIVIYVAGNAANGDLQPSGDHIYTKTYTLTSQAAGGATPTIDPTLTAQNQTVAPNAVGQAVAPGSLVAIYGTNIASAGATASAIPLSTTLSDVGVSFNGTAAPMVGIAHNVKIGSQTLDQINAIVPWKVAPGTASVVVTSNGAISPPVNVSVGATGPGVFYIATDSTGTNRPLVYNNSDNTFSYPAGIFGTNLKTRPAGIANDILILWCTGLGAVTVTPPDGAPATDSNGNFVESDTVVKPVVLVGNRQANVLFSGLTQYPSIYQVNIKLDPSTPTGDAVPIQVQMNGVTTTDQLKIAVTN